MTSKENYAAKITVPRFTKEKGFQTNTKYSEIMKKIKSSKTKPEICFRKSIWKQGVRYRLNNNKLPGRPDLVIKKFKIVIFVDGDFWHGYNWIEKKTKLKNNTNYWIPKIERNIQRDNEVNQLLKSAGWTVLRFWEHEINKDINQCTKKVIEFIEKGKGDN